MTKKVLVILIVSLFFVLIGMVALYFQYTQSDKPASDLLLYIPEHSVTIVSIDNVSGSLNNFFNNELINQSFRIEGLKETWQVLDSISSRNYKTADILSSGTAFICADSVGDFLVLTDIQNKANAHFIDQFLAHNSSQQRIGKYKNGLKSFQTQDNDTMYYFLKDDVFAVSSSSWLALRSLNQPSYSPDSNLYRWQQKSQTTISVYVRRTEQELMRLLCRDNRWFTLTESVSASYWFDIITTPGDFKLRGELKLDSSKVRKEQWNLSPFSNPTFYDFNDTFVLASGYFQFNLPDSLGALSGCDFHYIEFRDSLAQMVSFMISDDPFALEALSRVKLDTSGQVIPMADPEIKEVLALDKETGKWLMPYYPLMADSAKYLMAGIGKYTVVSYTMESILFYAKHFPFKFLKQRKIQENSWLSYKQRYGSDGYFINIKFRLPVDEHVGFTYSIGPAKE